VNLYIDTSALMRRYDASRNGGTEFSDVFSAAVLHGTALITAAEVTCALYGIMRAGGIRRKHLLKLTEQFDRDYALMAKIPVTEALVGFACGLAERVSLRGYDAIHLAAAMTWKSVIGEQVTVATFDNRMWNAAQSEGFDVWPPDLSVFK
jgi:predicted nucleic acid-binding protein